METLNDSVSNLSVCLQEHKEQTTAELAHLQTSLSSTQSSLANQTGQLSKLDDLPSKLDTLNTSLAHLQTSLSSTQLSNKLDTFNTSLSQHQLQTTAELALLKTSLNTSLSQHQLQTTAELAHLKTSLNTSLSQHQLQTTAELALLKTSLNTSLSQHQLQTTAELDHLKTSLNTSLSQHQLQTTVELALLKTSLNSKLDSLMATAAHLSSDHQEIQTNISDVQCMDTQQRLLSNLTHQLETIKDCIESPSVYSCGGTGGWRRVVYLDMTDPHTTCPSGWNMTGYSKRTCGRNSTGAYTCSSATFPVSGGEYSRVCGRIKAYQWGDTLAFLTYHYGIVTTIDGPYACGVSVTHGTPRNHIWTFVAGTSEGNPT